MSKSKLQVDAGINAEYREQAERYAKMGEYARANGYNAPGTGELPDLNDDGSLVDPTPEPDDTVTDEEADAIADRVTKQ